MNKLAVHSVIFGVALVVGGNAMARGGGHGSGGGHGTGGGHGGGNGMGKGNHGGVSGGGIHRPPVGGGRPVVGIAPTRPPSRPPVVGISRPPVGIRPPVVVGISRPPVGIVRPPVGIRPPIGIVVGTRPPIGIRPPIGVRPPVGVIVGSRPPIGIRPPVGIRPPIGIRPPVGVRPPIGVIVGIPRPPVRPPVGFRPPHHWPRPPICIVPRWVTPPVVYYPVRTIPMPVVQDVSLEAYDLSCRLPENMQAQDLLAVDAVLTRTAIDRFDVQGTVYGADNSQTQLAESALGVMDRNLNLSLSRQGSIYLEAVADQDLAGYLRGKIELFGRQDNQGLLCTLTPHRQ